MTSEGGTAKPDNRDAERLARVVTALVSVGRDEALAELAPIAGIARIVQHAIYKPRASGRQTFQLHPSGWHFAPGHRAKLELLGRDYPYAQPSNGDFEVTVRDLVLDLPVRQRPDGDQIARYDPP